MAMVGANAEELEAAAAKMRHAADELDVHSAALGRTLGGLAWIGQLASAFVNMWNSKHNAQLGSTARFIRDAADKLEAQARQQRDTSSADGLGSGGGWGLADIGRRIRGGIGSTPPADEPGWGSIWKDDSEPPRILTMLGAPEVTDFLREQYDQLSILQGVKDFGKAGPIGVVSALGAIADTALWLKDGTDFGFWDGEAMKSGVSAIASGTSFVAGIASGGAALPALGTALGAAPVLPVVAAGAATFGLAYGATNYVLDHVSYNGMSLGDHMSGSAYDAIYGGHELSVSEADALTDHLSGPMGLVHYVEDAIDSTVSGIGDAISNWFE
jgi:uncharacterized protein YukE